MTETTPAAPAATEQTAPAAPAETVPSVNESAAPQGTLQGPEGEASGTPEAATTGEADQGVEPSKSTNKVSARERIEQLARDRRQAEAERDHYLARLQEIEAAQQKQQPQNLDPLNFNSDAEYQTALQRELAKNVSDAVKRELLSDQQRTAEARAAQARDQAWDTRVQSFREKAPDFDQVALSPNSHPVTPFMADLIKESDQGPEIAYWLAKNHQESARIAALPPARAAVEIGRLEARFAQPAAPRFTQAPAPVKTVSSGNAAPVKAPGEMSFAEYETWRMAQMNKGK